MRKYAFTITQEWRFLGFCGKNKVDDRRFFVAYVGQVKVRYFGTVYYQTGIEVMRQRVSLTRI